MQPGGPHGGLIHVVAAAVTDATGRILIAQRPAGKPLAGEWEFPGGKLEPGESRVQALTRELREELGITLNAHPRPLLRLRHTYAYGEVLLDMWVVRRYRGAPSGMDGQPIRWCTQQELESTAELLPADRPVVRALRLPERLSTADSPQYRVVDIGIAAMAGAKGSPAPGTPGEGGDEGGAIPDRLVGMFCSNAAECASAAAAEHADFLVMRHPLQDGELSALCNRVSLPVFACCINLETAWSLGASGVHQLPGSATAANSGRKSS